MSIPGLSGAGREHLLSFHRSHSPLLTAHTLLLVHFLHLDGLLNLLQLVEVRVIAVFLKVEVKQMLEVHQSVGILAGETGIHLRLVAPPREEFVLKLYLEGGERAQLHLTGFLGLAVYSSELGWMTLGEGLKVGALS